MKKITKILCVSLAVFMLAMMTSCGGNDKSAEPTLTPKQTAKPASTTVPVTGELSKNTSRTVLFTMSDGQTFTVKCEPEYAPETAENFLQLVKSGFYDGLTFHRILDNFVAQGGDPQGTGMGGSENKIKGEFAENGFAQNTLKHNRGSVAMARSTDPDSASSQFYICYQALPQLDGKYAVFGEVTEGMEVIDSFLSVSRDNSGMPETPIVIESAEIVE